VAPSHQERAAAARAPHTYTVRIGDYSFTPARLTAHVGDRIRFVNGGRIQHTVADTDVHGRILSRAIHPRPLAHGAVPAVTLRRAGRLHYLCTFHPTLMKGVLVVQP